MILNPYYAGFDRDLAGGRSGVKLIGVDYKGRDGDEWEGEDGLGEAFEDALQRATEGGIEVSLFSASLCVGILTRRRIFTVTTKLQVRAVLICNPHNPLGTTVSRSTLAGYCRFAQKHDLHIVSDEIYAMSVYDNPSTYRVVLSEKYWLRRRLTIRVPNDLTSGFPEARPFNSALSVDLDRDIGVPFDKGRLHVVYGMSKDFCANGFR